MSLNGLNAQEVIKYNGKSITIQGPKCFSMEINGTTLEYHQKIVDTDLYSTVVRKRSDGVVREVTVRKVSVKVITDTGFRIDYLNTYGEVYSCTILTDIDKVISTVYEGSKIGNNRETNLTIYFSDKQQLTDFIAEIKKKRGF
ncbi:hypothetical protein [Fluviicola taffensis]|nr:hypothetical protein [Fluviicola taffensis]